MLFALSKSFFGFSLNKIARRSFLRHLCTMGTFSQIMELKKNISLFGFALNKSGPIIIYLLIYFFFTAS